MRRTCWSEALTSCGHELVCGYIISIMHKGACLHLLACKLHWDAFEVCTPLFLLDVFAYGGLNPRVELGFCYC